MLQFSEIFLKVIVSVYYSNIMYWHQHITYLLHLIFFLLHFVFFFFFLLFTGTGWKSTEPTQSKWWRMMKMTAVSSSTWIAIHRSVMLFALEHIIMYCFPSLCQNVECCPGCCERLANRLMMALPPKRLFLYLCISISLLRPYTLFSRSPLVNKTLFENACELEWVVLYFKETKNAWACL